MVPCCQRCATGRVRRVLLGSRTFRRRLCMVWPLPNPIGTSSIPAIIFSSMKLSAHQLRALMAVGANTSRPGRCHLNVTVVGIVVTTPARSRIVRATISGRGAGVDQRVEYDGGCLIQKGCERSVQGQSLVLCCVGIQWVIWQQSKRCCIVGVWALVPWSSVSFNL